MNLYEIDQRIAALAEELTDPETGEIMDFTALNDLAMERDTKIENVALFVKNSVSEAAAIKAEEKALAERRKAIENRAERLKLYLHDSLNGEKFETPRCSITWRKSSALDVTDKAALAAWAVCGHAECLRYSEPDVDKKAVTDLIKGGVMVPGAEIVQRLSMGVK